MPKPKPDPETIEVAEYLCEVCGLVYFTDYGAADYCPKCGANDKGDIIRCLRLIVKEAWNET